MRGESESAVVLYHLLLHHYSVISGWAWWDRYSLLLPSKCCDEARCKVLIAIAIVVATGSIDKYIFKYNQSCLQYTTKLNVLA